ncbi:hypothetical protein ACIRS3_35560 [Streptomyces virginiae]|uniref:hypothetical protein n=1 Tax=Streptomyces virginiae TaxID=1961 RepID=UPI003822FCFE
MTEGGDVGMGEQRGALRGLRILIWAVIAVEVPVYLVWLVQVGYQAGQQLPCGGVARWAPPVLLPPAAVLLCVAGSVEDPSFLVFLLSATVTALGMLGLFFTPAAASRQLPDVIRLALPPGIGRTDLKLPESCAPLEV